MNSEMYPKERRGRILETLMAAAPAFVTTEQLAKKLDVSIRTIQYDIQVLNEELQQNNEPQIEKSPQYGVKWERTTILNPMKETHEYTPFERKQRIILILVFDNSPVTTEIFIEKNRVSKSTVLQDLKELREEMATFDITLDYQPTHGRILSGEEHNIRSFVINYLFMSELPFTLTQDITKERTSDIHDQLIKTEQTLNVHFTDDMQLRLNWITRFFIQRIQQGFVLANHLEADEDLITIGTNYYKPLLAAIPKSEAHFIGKFILGANRISDENTPQDSVIRCVDEVIDRVELFTSVKIENKKQLQNDLIMHLKPLMFRLKYDLPLQYSMKDEIKQQFPEIFTTTKYALQPFEMLVEKELSDDEVSFIAILIGGHLKNSGSSWTQEKTIQIVCSMGVSTSRFIEGQLSQLLPKRIKILPPLSLRSFNSQNEKVDLTISTIHLHTDNPLIIVDAVLTADQKEAILQVLGVDTIQVNASLNGVMKLIAKHAKIENEEGLRSDLQNYLFKKQPLEEAPTTHTLLDYLTESFVQVYDRADSWEDAIALATQPLLKKKLVTQSYLETMIHNVKKFGPYIVLSPGIAMPHAREEDGITQAGMSLLILKEPVLFSDKPKDKVSLVIVSALTDYNESGFILRQIGKLINNQGAVENILKSKHPTQIIKYLQSTL